MSKIGVFYGSTMGFTKTAAELIADKLSGDVRVNNIASAKIEDLLDYDNLVLGASTWGYGELQDDWISIIDDIKGKDFSNKKVALFGLGDQQVYPDTFVDAIGIIYKELKEVGATIVGETSTEGYEFDGSVGLIDDKFVGLALDDNNQSDLTEERVTSWVNDIEKSFN